jgi:hypothetical protein
MLFELFQRRYDMITWQFNLFLLQQVIKDPITLSDAECIVYSSCRLLETDFKLEHTNGLDLAPNSIWLRTCRPLRRPMTRYYTRPH